LLTAAPFTPLRNSNIIFQSLFIQEKLGWSEQAG
jgi:hypothetical protein